MQRLSILAAITLGLVLAGALALGAPGRTLAQTGGAAGGPSLGDVNCDGVVNSIDAALILQYDAGLVDELVCGVAADANQDGIRNAVDAAVILQYNAGLIDRLPPPQMAT